MTVLLLVADGADLAENAGVSSRLKSGEPDPGIVASRTEAVSNLLQGLRGPRDPVFDAAGQLYIAETDSGLVLKLSGERW